MKEDDIRPLQLRRANADLRRADVRRLLESAGEFVGVCCPACRADRPLDAFQKDGFRFVRCGPCDTRYVSPRPTFEQLMHFYATADSIRHWAESIFPATEPARRERIFAPRAHKLDALCRRLELRGGTVIDIGAGFGTFCEELQTLDRFDDIVAVETAPRMVGACRKKGLTVVDCPVEQATLPRATAITAFELIEHVFDPRPFLDSCAAALRPGGLLYLTTPNSHGFEVQALGQDSRTFGAPEHLNYFHPGSLRRLLVDCGFEMLSCETPGALDAELVRQHYLQQQQPPDDPVLRTLLMDDWEQCGSDFQKFLVRFGWSAHMAVAAIWNPSPDL